MDKNLTVLQCWFIPWVTVYKIITFNHIESYIEKVDADSLSV